MTDTGPATQGNPDGRLRPRQEYAGQVCARSGPKWLWNKVAGRDGQRVRLSSASLASPRWTSTDLVLAKNRMVGAAVANPADLVRHPLLSPFFRLPAHAHTTRSPRSSRSDCSRPPRRARCGITRRRSTGRRVSRGSIARSCRRRFARASSRPRSWEPTTTSSTCASALSPLPALYPAPLTAPSPRRSLKRDFPQHFHEGIRTHLVASGIAGFCCSAASNPIDVIKVRIMSDKTGQYRGSVHCAALLLKNEGASSSSPLSLSLRSRPHG